MRVCVLIPVFEHGQPLAAVLAELAPSGLECFVVDDGSGPETRAALDALAQRHAFVRLIRRPHNGGKGAALKTGFRAAAAAGFSHAIQLDADGQHDPGDVPRFAAALRDAPEALVLGVPLFDASAPRLRIAARQLSKWLVWAACRSRVVPDPLCGFRGVPLGPVLEVLDAVPTGDRMEFEPELAVRLVWRGTPVRTLTTRVVYPRDGLSHFSLRRDYPRLAALYLRLLAGMLWRATRGRRAGRTERWA